MAQNFTLLRARLLTVAAYRNIARLPVSEKLARLLLELEQGQGEAALADYCDLYALLSGSGHRSLGGYFSEHLHYDAAPYPELAASGKESPAQAAAARRDVETFSALAALTPEDWREQLRPLLPEDWQGVLESLPCWEASETPLDFEALSDFYRRNGAGLFSKYRAFLWRDGKLLPIENPDFLPPEKLVGYTIQRNQVYANTAGLVAGKRVNNVLLYGESGTGKSATVKSLLGVPEFSNLRLIEMDKSQLAGIPELVRMLGHRPQKFILYIDDLAFDKDDQTYSLLKTILEGGLEHKPENVAIYATSNRRHLVRETFSDRAGDEVDATETISEKTSLSERFGLRIPYLALNQEQFLDLAWELASAAGLANSREALRPAAIRWTLRHPGRTPRVAQQFVQSLNAGR